ncbi:MAG: molecular chaperone HtpG [Fibrobacter sp.]|nr:molecular chaperone HtpG [Fibrobacter sp.]
MIHSLYSNPEIFVRELISNAADALDKVRFESISNPDLLKDNSELRIDVQVDEDKKQVVIEDTGIGMNHQDLMENLGTIARSGTKHFLKNLSGDAKKDVNLIGQFGVGFYSVFMVAAKVEVITRKAGESEAWAWTSEGTGEFSISSTEKDGRGTRIVVHLKDDDDSKEFASSWRVRSIIQKYSEFVTHPIYLETIEKPEEKSAEEDKKDDDVVDVPAGPERLNEKPALWRRNPNEVEAEQYQEFYSNVSGDYSGSPAATYSHSHIEGINEYWSLIYVPSKAPFGIFHSDRSHGLKLYVKRVFIMDDCKDLLPPWLRFVRGVIDSEDLPLNVSREILQNNRIINNIKNHVTKKTLESLQSLADDKPEEYAEFWKELGSILKEGFHMNWEWLDELKSLLRFNSTVVGTDKLTSLKDYVSRMRDEQKDIYYITGENLTTLEASPHLEAFKAKGFEVLYMADPIDEFMMGGLQDFEGKSFKDISRGDIALEKTAEEEASEKESQNEYSELCAALQKALDEDIETVRVTTRLKDSACVLTNKEDAMSAHMERLMTQMGQNNMPKSKRILEINPNHAINKKLLEKVKAKEDLGDWPTVLMGQALLAEGSPLPNPGLYVQAVTKLLS